MNLIVSGLIVIFLCILAVFLYTWYRFRKSIYIHTNENQVLIKKYPLKHKEITVTTKDGFHISAWYIPVSKPKAVVILIPGFTNVNGGKALMLPHASYLIGAGYSTMLLDLRATGGSDGNKSYLGIKEWQDVEAAYDYVVALPENRNTEIGLFGISMGATTALITKGETGKGDFVIASVPYASFDKEFAFQLTKDNLPPILFLPFLKLSAAIEFGPTYCSYDPEKLIKDIRVPILVFAAKKDGDVGYDQAAYVYQVANEPKYFWAANTQHDIHAEEPKEFESRVLSFLASL